MKITLQQIFILSLEIVFVRTLRKCKWMNNDFFACEKWHLYSLIIRLTCWNYNAYLNSYMNTKPRRRHRRVLYNLNARMHLMTKSFIIVILFLWYNFIWLYVFPTLFTTWVFCWEKEQSSFLFNYSTMSSHNWKSFFSSLLEVFKLSIS